MAESAKLPSEGESPFACPHCNVVAQQEWDELFSNGIRLEQNPSLCRCEECGAVSLWFLERMLVPTTGGAPAPSPDLPESVRSDYNEARAVAGNSSRAAAALLRLAIEKLCVELNGEGPTLDQHIARLYAKGLDESTAVMFDAVRLGGNNAVHPLDRIGIGGNPEIVRTLFYLVNEIADEVITKPRQRAEATAWIPQGERERMAERNRKAKERLQQP